MITLLNNYTFIVVAIGSTLLGLACGVIGTFSVLKKESLIGDAVAHASLPGICLAYIITGEKSLHVLLIGALISGILSILIIKYLSTYKIFKFDNILSLVLATCFGFGIVLITYIQTLSGANKAGLNNFIFGQAAAILKSDLYIIICVSILIILVVIVYWHKFKVVIFDETFANVIFGKKKTNYYNKILSFLLIVAIIVGLEMVGVILISTLLIVPAISARQWTNNLLTLVILSGFFGGICGLFGTAISSSELNLPTGPVIVLLLSIVFIVSILFSPKRGMLKSYLYKRKRKKEIVKKLMEGEYS